MAWLTLTIAGLLEVVWAVGLKYSQGFTRFWPSVITIGAMVLSVVLLSLAMRSLPMGTAYAIWVGIGAVGAVIMGVFLFDEPTSTVRLLSVGMILAGIIGLKLSTP